MSPDELVVSVLIKSLPVALHERAQAHSDALMREFKLLAEQLREEGAGDLPARLIGLVDTLNGRYAVFTEEQEDALDAAVAAGHDSVDLHYQLPADAGLSAQALGNVLDEADEYCRAGQHLLTLATPPDCLAYRQWFLDEFVRQVAGDPPTPWPVSSHAQLLESSGS